MENTFMLVLLLTIFFAVILPRLYKKPRVVASAVICFALVTGCNYAATGKNNLITDNQAVNNRTVNNHRVDSQIEVVPAEVTSVIDGDTVDVIVDRNRERIRLIGVDTPETKHPTQPVEAYGPEASNFTNRVLNGKSVFLEFDVTERDKYGRMLAYVWLEKPLTGSNRKSDPKCSMRFCCLMDMPS
ncbi:thermonuclease family protein [Phosphitispora fastidiosa]|uniref:thermonuclease family protein n=1 Tax=Phosphitispora fastidiosa TaxID=2837202 RepID=UPI001E52BF5A|nr:thermonuclease family protein [Phosphitispora fastidiosa]MBU7005814.1 endonuclease YncB(thermonuclease family) [Phosphitispora fastidiosa]